MPLHGSQVKADIRKDGIIWARFHLEELQKKCGVNATKDISLGTISSKAFCDKCTHMMLVHPRKSIFYDSSVRRRSVARVISSQHSSSNKVGEIPEVREHNIRNLLTVGWPHFSVIDGFEEGVECNSLDIFPIL